MSYVRDGEAEYPVAGTVTKRQQTENPPLAVILLALAVPVLIFGVLFLGIGWSVRYDQRLEASWVAENPALYEPGTVVVHALGGRVVVRKAWVGVWDHDAVHRQYLCLTEGKKTVWLPETELRPEPVGEPYVLPAMGRGSM